MKEEIVLYTMEDCQELKSWFEARESALPETLQIDGCTYTPDLKSTISMVLDQAYICCGNPQMQGSYYLLLKIKRKLEEET